MPAHYGRRDANDLPCLPTGRSRSLKPLANARPRIPCGTAAAAARCAPLPVGYFGDRTARGMIGFSQITGIAACVQRWLRARCVQTAAGILHGLVNSRSIGKMLGDQQGREQRGPCGLCFYTSDSSREQVELINCGDSLIICLPYP